jgi:16S rRNA (guanine966-N2)-methyltransferase
MKLRIVSGTLRGRVIRCAERKLTFRPTLERTRQSIADMLMPRINGSRCADLCAGSGAFGFELISRGAGSVDFVENDRRCAAMIRDNAANFGVLEKCRVFEQDVAGFVSSPQDRYDIIFFDPPYEADGMAALVPIIRKLLSPDGILLYQRRKTKVAPHNPENPLEIKTFGDTIVECYNRSDGVL